MIAALEEEQTAIGAIRSYVHLPAGEVPDENGFVTGLAMRELWMRGAGEEAAALRDRAGRFLLRCESPRFPGLFSFWPEYGYPSWIGDVRLYEDADDSAICALELVRCGIRTEDALVQTARRLAFRHRVHDPVMLTAPWHRLGVFPTWLWPGARNTIDCCVNANVVALLAAAHMRDAPGYAEACAMIEEATEWAGAAPERLRAIVPYYPHPSELARALEHALRCGAAELEPAARRLQSIAWLHECADDTPVCSSADGRIVWTAPALQRARRGR
ncbi:MAG TPA: hypothetical protein VF266_16980 [Thermoanaerobaculia bacterium]